MEKKYVLIKDIHHPQNSLNAGETLTEKQWHDELDIWWDSDFKCDDYPQWFRLEGYDTSKPVFNGEDMIKFGVIIVRHFTDSGGWVTDEEQCVIRKKLEYYINVKANTSERKTCGSGGSTTIHTATPDWDENRPD